MSRCADGKATSVTIRNVPAFVHELDGEANGIRYDMAFGGNFYAIADAAAVGLRGGPRERARADRGRPGADGGGARAGSPRRTRPSAAATTSSGPTSPTPNLTPPTPPTAAPPPRFTPDGSTARRAGPGTSARMAQRHARGWLELGAPFVHESIIGTRFTGRLVGETTVGGRPAVIPEITGRAWITGMASYVLDPTDPFPARLSHWLTSSSSAPGSAAPRRRTSWPERGLRRAGARPRRGVGGDDRAGRGQRAGLRQAPGVRARHDRARGASCGTSSASASRRRA